MSADPFTEAASVAAEEQWTRKITPGHPLSGPERMNRRIGFTMGAKWARTHLAAQEPTDAEVRTIAQHLAHAALDWTDDETGEHTHEPSCANWEPYWVEARAALTAARRDEGK